MTTIESIINNTMEYLENNNKMPPMPVEYKKKFNEYMKQYRDTHKTNINASRKKWIENHKNDEAYKQKKNELARRFYNNNKDTLLCPSRCACGGIISRLTSAQHKKTQKHIKYIENLDQSIE